MDKRMANPAGINGSSPDPDGRRARRRQAIEDWKGIPAVYRFFDAQGHLLYIGTSKCWPMRADQHRKTAPWWGDVDRAVIKVYARNLDAYRAEAEAIRTEGPLHNIRHTPRFIEPRRRKPA